MESSRTLIHMAFVWESVLSLGLETTHRTHAPRHARLGSLGLLTLNCVRTVHKRVPNAAAWPTAVLVSQEQLWLQTPCVTGTVIRLTNSTGTTHASQPVLTELSWLTLTSIAQHAQPTARHAHRTQPIVSHAVVNTSTISHAWQNVHRNGSVTRNSSVKSVPMTPNNFALNHWPSQQPWLLKTLCMFCTWNSTRVWTLRSKSKTSSRWS